MHPGLLSVSKHSTSAREHKIRHVNPSNHPVPVPRNGALPALAVPAQLDLTLSDLADALLGVRGGRGWRFPEYSAKDIDTVKQALAMWPRLRLQWADFDRPASPDQIAGEIVKLTAGMSIAGNVDPDLITNTLCEDIAELRPTSFALMRACRAVRGICKFLDQVELEKQIRQLNRQSDRYREAMAQDPEQYLKEAEEWTARKIAEVAEQKRRDEAERKWLKKADRPRYEILYDEDEY
jgi:hypothetical protein